MRIAFIEPHLKLFGGIRHVLEIGNELVQLGHDVCVYIPPGQSAACTWMDCLPEVRFLGAIEHEPFDALIFNNEPDFAWVGTFANVRLRVFWLLHFALLYDKAFSWVSYRCPVDLWLAESRWIAQCLQREIGVRAVVINSGVNPRHFRPVPMPKTYEVLCYGDSEREWKGTSDIEQACRALGLPLEKYDGKGIPQERMAAEYCRARVFVHGSWYEGFGLPGLEALACGVPLVSTDSGGPRDYAYDGETALLVPPRDPRAMADAIARLRRDPALVEKLTRQGLELVEKQFRWPAKTRELVRVLEPALERARALEVAPTPRDGRPAPAGDERSKPAAQILDASDAQGSPGLGRKLNALLASSTADLVTIMSQPARAGEADPAAVLADGDAALACGSEPGLKSLPWFSRAPPLASRWVGRRADLVRAGGFGEGLQGHAGTTDFLLWGLWWQGKRVLGPEAPFERPTSIHLLRTFAARGAALARFLYTPPTQEGDTLRPYGVEPIWANGPRSVPPQSFAEALGAQEERVIGELDRQLGQRSRLPEPLVRLWSELSPTVAQLVLEERRCRAAREELLREVQEEKQANTTILQQLTESYSEGQALRNRLLAERELVRVGLLEQAGDREATVRSTWNLVVLLLGAGLALLCWPGGSRPWRSVLASDVLVAVASATLAHVAWRVACAVIDARRAERAEGG